MNANNSSQNYLMNINQVTLSIFISVQRLETLKKL